MTDRSQLTLEFVTLGLIMGLATLILAIMIYRKKHDPGSETKEVLEAIEGVRQQQSAEHSAMQAEQRTQGGYLRQLLDRLGFLRRIK